MRARLALASPLYPKIHRLSDPSTKRSKSFLTRDGMLRMMFRLGLCAETNWRCQRGCDYLAKVITGVKFTDGIETTQSDQVAPLDSGRWTPRLTTTPNQHEGRTVS